MTKFTTKEQTALINETTILKGMGSEEALHNVRCIVTFLKKNKLSLGYTKGTTAGLFTNYEMGLSHINPLEYGLLSERNYLRKPYQGHPLPHYLKPFFGILLNKESYQKTKSYLKENKCTKGMLEFYNIAISYDKRLDNIKIYKKYTFQELSKLAIQKNKSGAELPIKDFKNYIDMQAFNNTSGLKEFWNQELITAYHSLATKYSFLKINNSLNVILFQEEWMTLIKKITGLSIHNVNLFRKASCKKVHLKEFEKRLKNKLKEKYKVGKDFKQIYDILMNSALYTNCKAHIASDAYIDLVSGKNEKIKP